MQTIDTVWVGERQDNFVNTKIGQQAFCLMHRMLLLLMMIELGKLSGFFAFLPVCPLARSPPGFFTSSPWTFCPC